LIRNDSIVIMLWQECIWPILFTWYYYSHTNLQIYCLELFNYLMHHPLSPRLDIQRILQGQPTVLVQHNVLCIEILFPMLKKTWVFIMITNVTGLNKCIYIRFAFNYKKHMIFDGFSLISNGSSVVVEVVSSLLSKGSYITITQSCHGPLLWKFGWAWYKMLSFLYSLYMLMMDFPNKFEFMSLNSLWNQCNTISCNLLTNGVPWCHFLYLTVTMIPFNIVAKWCPTNSDLTLSLFLLSVIIKSSSFIFTRFGDTMHNAFPIQEVSYKHSATWSKKEDCCFCVLLAGHFAKLIKLCLPGLASQFCGHPNPHVSHYMKHIMTFLLFPTIWYTTWNMCFYGHEHFTNRQHFCIHLHH